MPPSRESGAGVLFAGGGTGGHLLPSVAVARKLAENHPSLRLAFAISNRPSDRTILDRAIAPPIEHAEILPIPAQPPSTRPDKLARFLASWGPSVRASRSLLRSMPRRTVVVSLGGYVAPPVAQAARVERRPVVVVNIDATPGKASRWINRRAARAFSVYDAPDPSWRRITPIVRREIIETDPRTCRQRLGLDTERKTLLVTGGSQGARTINDFILAFLDASPDALIGWQVLHQTGTGRPDIGSAYDRAGVPALCRPYFADMGTCWGASHLALSRAGAGAVAESWATRTPALFMPYPYHRDEHQRPRNSRRRDRRAGPNRRTRQHRIRRRHTRQAPPRRGRTRNPQTQRRIPPAGNRRQRARARDRRPARSRRIMEHTRAFLHSGVTLNM